MMKSRIEVAEFFCTLLEAIGDLEDEPVGTTNED